MTDGTPAGTHLELDFPSTVQVLTLPTPLVSQGKAAAATVGLATPITGLGVLDLIAGAQYSVTVTATHGTLFTSGGGGTVTGNGSAALKLSGTLPQLNVDLAALSFTGTSPGQGTISVVASFAGANSPVVTSGVTVKNPVPPVVAHQTGNQTWKQGQQVSLQLPTNTFSDPQGESLSYSATLANGSPLPPWLVFNAKTGAFTGTVPAGIETLLINVTATNTSGLSTAETFAVTVPAAPPVVAHPTANQTETQGQHLAFQLPANTFTDPQGEGLSYSASQSNGSLLPAWLVFDAKTETFTGTVPVGPETLSLKVTATDTSGLSATETFSLTVPAIPPVVAHPTPMQTWLQGQHISFQLPANTFTDPQGEPLVYAARQANGAELPTWLAFNAKTETFTGIVPAGVETLSLKLTATDSSGLSTAETFSVTVPPSAPVIAHPTPTQTWMQGQHVSYQLPADTFIDPQKEPLVYVASQANGTPLPVWLTFNAKTETFAGTVPAGIGTLSLKVMATDTSGLSTAESFSVTVTHQTAMHT
jgi:hypothetical protein